MYMYKKGKMEQELQKRERKELLRMKYGRACKIGNESRKEVIPFLQRARTWFRMINVQKDLQKIKEKEDND